ncbi:DUF697 domain-containing protein [Kovacikia minuta CCNUW1]|uniref:slr1306 family protein n=1 Tax=Kovacikia minuta TaxID=2931930 RepID=UPI001CC9C7C2|nr:DUF697 domain-containing protein [Kovacikia minuta]UBF24995.1 DUF697 domain-containing protein [Kovacikia minuta CCNUW1]
MAAKRQRPLLIGGITLAVGIGMLETLSHTLGEWSVYAVFLGAAGGGIWWLRQKTEPTKTALLQLPQAIDLTVVKRALTEAEKVITQLVTEVEDPQEPVCAQVKPQVSLLQSQISQVATDMNREEIRLTVIGGKGNGKTTLLQVMQSEWAVRSPKLLSFSEAASDALVTHTALSMEMLAQQQTIAADLVLFLVTGDITESEFQTVKHLAASKRILLLLNKQDQYLPEERSLLLNQLQQRTRGILAATDVVAVSAAPNPLKVRQHQSDGSCKEWLEEQKPDISALTQRLEQILQQESQQLVLNSSFNHAAALRIQARTVLNDVRRTRAMPVIEQFQWIAAGTAFVSPLPSMDLVATVAINAQMIVDLGTIYRQKFSLQQAQKSATALGSLLLKLGLVELSTRAISTLLKSNALTFVAGGCIQGISAAYLTRVVGLSLIEYFHSQDPNLTLTEASPLAIERFSQILQRVFQQNQQVSFLQALINQAFDRFSPTQPQLTAATTSVFTPPSSVLSSQTSVLSPLHTLHPTPHLPNQEIEILEQNRTDSRLPVANLDSTTLPTP